MGSRWRIRIAVVTVVLLGSLFPVGTPANAAGCSTEQVIFWRGNAGAYGTTNSIRTSNRSLDSSCPGFRAWSTANLTLGGVYGNWVETGWEQNYNSNGNPYYFWFIEWGLNFTKKGRNEGAIECLSPGTFAQWRVGNNPVGSTSFNLSVNCGSGYSSLGTFDTGTYSRGIVTGETGRFGTNTGMKDVQQSLAYKNSNGSWVSWSSGPSCYIDGITGWQGYKTSSTSYKVDTGSMDCNNT